MTAILDPLRWLIKGVFLLHVVLFFAFLVEMGWIGVGMVPLDGGP